MTVVTHNGERFPVMAGSRLVFTHTTLDFVSTDNEVQILPLRSIKHVDPTDT